MPEFDVVATLDEKAVQKVAAGEIEPPKKKRAPAQRQASDLTYMKVDRRVLETVQSLNPNPRCIQYVSETEVIIWNRPGPWPTTGGSTQ